MKSSPVMYPDGQNQLCMYGHVFEKCHQATVTAPWEFLLTCFFCCYGNGCCTFEGYKHRGNFTSVFHIGLQLINGHHGVRNPRGQGRILDNEVFGAIAYDGILVDTSGWS